MTYWKWERDKSVVAEVERMKIHLTQPNGYGGQQIPTGEEEREDIVRERMK